MSKRRTKTGDIAIVHNMSGKSQRKILDSFQSYVQAQVAKLRNFPHIPESDLVNTSMMSIMQLFAGERISSRPLSWDEFMNVMKNGADSKTTKEIYDKFISGFIYNEEFCDVFLENAGRKLEFKKFRADKYGTTDWRVAYAVMTLFNLGLCLWENLSECDVIIDIIAHLAHGLKLQDFDSLHMIFGHNCCTVDDSLFMISHKSQKSTSMETTLFADLPILYESGILSRCLYGMMLLHLRNGNSAIVSDMVQRYVIYLPACINKTSKYLLRPEYQTRRRDLYKHYNIVDTAMVALSYGIIAIYDYLEQEHDLGYLIEKNYIEWYRNYISEYEYLCKVKTDERKSDNQFVDAMYLFESHKSRGVLIDRFVPRWIANLHNKEDGEISSYSVPGVILDNWISSNIDSEYAFDFWILDKSPLTSSDGICSFIFPTEYLRRFDMECPASVETLAAAWYMGYFPAKAVKDADVLNNKQNDINKLTDENSRLRNRIKKLQAEKDKYKIQCDFEKKTMSERVAKETESLTNDNNALSEQISSLEYQLEAMSNKLMAKTRECSKLTKEVKRLSVAPSEGYENDSESNEELKPAEPSFEMKVSRLCSYKYLFIRGNQVMIEKLTNLGFTNVVNFNEFEDRRSGIKFDHMVICTDKIAHKFRWWAQTQTSSSNGKTLYYSGSNVEALIDLLYEEIVD